MRSIALLACVLSCMMDSSLLFAGNGEAFSDAVPDRRYGEWRSARIGGGGYVMDIIPTADPHIYYLHTDVGGLYRSDDGGENWSMLHGALPPDVVHQEPRTVVVDPRDPLRIIICTGQHWANRRGGIFYSDDGGQSFSFALQAAFAGNGNERMWGPVMAIDPARPDVVIAGAMQDGVFRSEDFGRTWQQVGLCGINPTDIDFDRTQPGRVLLSARPYNFALLGNPNTPLHGGLFVSEDSGQTWTEIELAFAPFEILQAPAALGDFWLGIFPPSEVMRSDDGGRTWYPFSEGLPGVEADPRDEDGVITPESSVAPSTFNTISHGPDFMLLGGGDGTIWRRGAKDTEWIPLHPVAEAPDHWYGNVGNKTNQQDWVHFAKAISKLLVDPHHPEHWWLCDWYMVWKSTDAGHHWRYAGEGIEVTVIHNVTQTPDDPGLVHLGMTDNGYFYSLDGGNTFAQNWEVITNNIKDVAVSPAAYDRLYAIGPKIGGHWYSNHVYRSEDRGQSWVSAAMVGTPPSEKMRINSIALDWHDPARLYVTVAGFGEGDKGGIYRSDDGGETWTDFSQGLPSEDDLFRSEIFHVGREIAVSPEGSLVAFSHDKHRLFYRTPEASAWTEVVLDLHQPNSVAANPFKPGHFLLGSAREGLLESTDQGATWQRLQIDDPVRHVAFDQSVESRVAVGSDRGVLVSRDAGQSWRKLDTALPNRIGNPVAFAGDRVIAGTSGSGMFWIPLDPAAADPLEATTVPRDE